MLLPALVLLVVAAACLVAVVGSPRPVTRYYAVAADDLGPGTTAAWRAAAIGAAADAKELQDAIARVMELRDPRHTQEVLRDALGRTGGYVPVRVTL